MDHWGEEKNGMTIGKRWLAVPAIFGLVLITAFIAGSAATANVQGARTVAAKETDKAVFFTADGMRQDIVERYADQGVMPTMADFLKKGTKASGNGAAEHRCGLVQPRHRRVARRPRVHEQHVPPERPAFRHQDVSIRRECAPGRVDRTVR